MRPLNPTDAPQVVTLNRRQAVLESIRTKFSAPGVVQTAGFLRLVCRLVANQTELVFRVMDNQGPVLDTEVRLAQTDSFTATDVGFGLGVLLVAGAGTNQGADTVYTGPNPTAIAAGLTTAIFDAIHAGRLQFTADSVVYLPGWRMRNCRYVDTAQAGLDPGGGTVYSASAYDLEQTLAPMLPSITMSGAMKNEVRILLPRSIAYPGFATNHIDAVLELHGFLNQQGAEFRPDR